jgi:death-on-curing protein
MTRYLSVEQVVSLHQGLVGVMSGDPGIRDLRALDAAVVRPTTTFAGEDLYPTVSAKAACLLQAIVAATPFVTASKATAVVAAECFLMANGETLAASDQDLLQMVLAAERGEMGVEALAVWFSQRLQQRPARRG